MTTQERLNTSESPLAAITKPAEHPAEAPARTYLRAVTLGFVGGLRSMTPLTVLDWTKDTGSEAPEPASRIEAVLRSPATRVITTALAVSELVGDKLPFVPSRLKPAPLIGRLILGAQSGVGISQRYGHIPLLGALLGMAGAGIGSYAGYHFRTTLASRVRVPGLFLGVIEDGVALGLGWLAVKAGGKHGE